jgi:uncharacterized protein YeaO (DUF488 family)
MRFYPRGLRRELRDEYRGELAPAPALFADFKRHQAESGHDRAFALSRYESRFSLSDEAWARLGRLSAMSRTRDVYLVCQCPVGERCHREILMLLARDRFGARIGPVHHGYPVAERRLGNGRKKHAPYENRTRVSALKGPRPNR